MIKNWLWHHRRLLRIFQHHVKESARKEIRSAHKWGSKSSILCHHLIRELRANLMGNVEQFGHEVDLAGAGFKASRFSLYHPKNVRELPKVFEEHNFQYLQLAILMEGYIGSSDRVALRLESDRSRSLFLDRCRSPMATMYLFDLYIPFNCRVPAAVRYLPKSIIDSDSDDVIIEDVGYQLASVDSFAGGFRTSEFLYRLLPSEIIYSPASFSEICEQMLDPEVLRVSLDPESSVSNVFIPAVAYKLLGIKLWSRVLNSKELERLRIEPLGVRSFMSNQTKAMSFAISESADSRLRFDLCYFEDSGTVRIQFYGVAAGDILSP